MATEKDLDLMAWTLLGEAAGEGDKGMQAVANVILNRANSGQYPSSISEVVLQPKQFSAWNKGEGGNDPMGRYSKNSEAFKTARAIAAAAVRGELPDITGGALNYWAPRGMKGGKDPYWAKNVPEDQRLKIGNHVFLPQNPVPKAPLLAEAPVPATMSRELAYARGLANPGAALAAIQAATDSTAPTSPYGTPSAYAGGGLEAAVRPAATGLPYGAPASGTPGLQFTPSSISPEDFYAGMPGIRPATPPMPPEREDPFAQIIRQQQERFALEKVPFASDEALKQLAATKYGDGLLTTAPAGAEQYNPMQAFGAEAEPLGLTTRTVKTIPITGDTSVFDAAMAAQGSEAGAPKTYAADDALMRLAKQKSILNKLQQLDLSRALKKPTTISDIMNGMSARSAPSMMRDVTTQYVAPDGSVRTATQAGSNAMPLGERPTSVGPAPARNPLLGGTDVSAFAPGRQNLPPVVPPMPSMSPKESELAAQLRPVSNLVQSAPTAVAGGFGMTPVGGGLPAAMPASAPPAPVAPPQLFPSVTPAEPAVNRKGFYSGNPFGNYEVRRGETLKKVADQFNTTVDTLAAINNIPNPNKISSGAKLFVPQLSTAPVAAKSGLTATPTGGTVTPAQRSAISSSSKSSTPVSTYKAPTTSTVSKPATTSQPVSLYNPVVKTPMATTPTGAKVTQAQMNAIRGLKEGGPIPGYATGSAVLDWSGGADYQANLVKALKQVDTARKLTNLTPVGAVTNAVADTFFPEQTQRAVWNTAQAMAAPKSGTTTTRTTSTRDPSWSPSMMEGSPSSSRRSTSSRDRDEDRGTPSNSGGNSGSSGGIDGVTGTYTPPTQAQIDALYAPYFRAAAFPPAGYEPGVSGEFNYFPGSGPAAPTTPTTPTTPVATPFATKATDWFNTYANALRDRARKAEASKVMADDKTSFYRLFDKYRDTLGRKSSPTAEGWLSWLKTKGYAEGGAVSEPRLVLGKGGPTADKIPARIDGVHEARLSNGEFVMTAAAVRGLGGGDYQRGAEALMRLNDQFAPRKDTGTLKVEKVR